jgi:molybdate transport system substrate-binding protein
MSRKLALVLAVSMAAGLFASGARDGPDKTGSHKQVEIIVSAAASLTDALNEIITRYASVTPDVTVTPTYGASGSLQLQIEQGAPVDIFFSAAPKQMNALAGKGLILEGTRKDMLENKVVMVVPKKSSGISSFADAGTGKIRQIALGDPKSVPAGQYAEQVFTFLGILPAVQAKAVYAKDVRQVLAYVESGEVDAGVVYATDAATSANTTVAATAPTGSHDPVIYPAAVVKSSANPEAAKSFLAWLSGPEASSIFLRYGFAVK